MARLRFGKVQSGSEGQTYQVWSSRKSNIGIENGARWLMRLSEMSKIQLEWTMMALSDTNALLHEVASQETKEVGAGVETRKRQ